MSIPASRPVLIAIRISAISFDVKQTLDRNGGIRGHIAIDLIQNHFARQPNRRTPTAKLI